MPPTPDIPTPLFLVRDDDPQILHQAEQKLSRKKRLSHVFSRSKSSNPPEDGAVVASGSSQSLVGTASPGTRKRGSQVDTTQAPPPVEVDSGIILDDTALVHEDLQTDRYEWAIIYENQRGCALYAVDIGTIHPHTFTVIRMTVFSIPYYSSLSLLPTDPSPFTLPNASLKRSKQAPISLESYPLPDGNWRWVSRCWMIDMRADSGEVQHDGFEYNWMFRRTRWRAQVGSLNAGGWVRRRRWVRLMVRPAKLHAHTPKLGADMEGASPIPSPSSNSKATSDFVQRLNRLSLGSHFPPSLHTQGTDVSSSSMSEWAQQIHPDEVWMGDCASDWQRCRDLMRRVGRDGRKLELWKLWLGYYHPSNKANIEESVEGEEIVKGKDTSNRRGKQWTEDSGPMPSEMAYAEKLERDYGVVAPREYIVSVLREHVRTAFLTPDMHIYNPSRFPLTQGKHILSIFIFPESRVQFLKLVAQAGLLAELNVELGIGFDGTEIDFWSYVSGLENEAGAADLLSTPTSRNIRNLKTLSAPNLVASKSLSLPPNISRKGKEKLL